MREKTTTRLLLLNGLPASGKTTLTDWLAAVYPSSVVRVLPVFKISRRPLLLGEREHADTRLITPEKFATRVGAPGFYSYSFGEKRYGLWRFDLELALRESRNVVLTICDEPLLCRIADDFAHVDVVTVLIYADRSLAVQRLREEGRPASEDAARFARTDKFVRQYRATNYDRTILNLGSEAALFSNFADVLDLPVERAEVIG